MTYSVYLKCSDPTAQPDSLAASATTAFTTAGLPTPTASTTAHDGAGFTVSVTGHAEGDHLDDRVSVAAIAAFVALTPHGCVKASGYDGRGSRVFALRAPDGTVLLGR